MVLLRIRDNRNLVIGFESVREETGLEFIR